MFQNSQTTSLLFINTTITIYLLDLSKMFKKFDQSEQKAVVQMKGGVAKKTRTAIINTYGPGMQIILDEIWPKKGPRVDIMKCVDKVELIIVEGTPMFYSRIENVVILGVSLSSDPHIRQPYCTSSVTANGSQHSG